MKILIAGGTGFIGKPLVNSLKNSGHEIFLLSRKKNSSIAPGIQTLHWDAENFSGWEKWVEHCDAIINLTGEGIASKRWTERQKNIIVNSRIQSTRILVKAIQQFPNQSISLINGSAIGYYGNVPEGELTENASAGKGFLAETCQAWEQEALRAASSNVRVVCIRTGIVLEKNGGALQKMLFPFQLGLGGPLGDGKQWMSWIYLDDMVSLICYVLENKQIRGPVNATAPWPVRMKEFAKILGKNLHRPAILPAPSFAIRLLLGEMSEMLLEGQKVIPQKLIHDGFHFQYPDLDSALKTILKS